MMMDNQQQQQQLRNQTTPHLSAGSRREIDGRPRLGLGATSATLGRRRPPAPAPKLAVGAHQAGSLSSAASSSGCSSHECSSLEVSPTGGRSSQRAKQAQLQLLHQQQRVVADTTSGLDPQSEQQQQLYLSRTMSKAMVANRSQDLAENRNNRAPESLLPAGPSMSEFSAFTLRKSLKQRPQADRPQVAATARVRRASSTAFKTASVVATSGGSGCELTAARRRRSPSEQLYCDCCCPQQQQQHEQDLSFQHQQQMLGAARSGWRRATIVGRPPAPVAGRGGAAAPQTRRATVAPLVAGQAGSQMLRQRQARRSLPVPPPVVPLYKEAALLVQVAEPAPGKVAQGGARQEALVGLPVTKTNNSVNIQQQISDNNNNNNIGDGKIDGVSGEAGSITTTEMDRLGSGFYCELWQDLRKPSKEEEGTSAEHYYASEKYHKQPEISSDANVPTALGCPTTAAATLGRRTGKFLERLRLNFFGQATFNPNSCNNTINHNKPAASSSSGQLARPPPPPPMPDPSWSAPGLGPDSTEPGGPIYDTPEFEAAAPRLPPRAAAVAATAAMRPSIPPPPPPPPAMPPVPQPDPCGARIGSGSGCAPNSARAMGRTASKPLAGDGSHGEQVKKSSSRKAVKWASDELAKRASAKHPPPGEQLASRLDKFKASVEVATVAEHHQGNEEATNGRSDCEIGTETGIKGRDNCLKSDVDHSETFKRLAAAAAAEEEEEAGRSWSGLRAATSGTETLPTNKQQLETTSGLKRQAWDQLNQASGLSTLTSSNGSSCSRCLNQSTVPTTASHLVSKEGAWEDNNNHLNNNNNNKTIKNNHHLSSEAQIRAGSRRCTKVAGDGVCGAKNSPLTPTNRRNPNMGAAHSTSASTSIANSTSTAAVEPTPRASVELQEGQNNTLGKLGHHHHHHHHSRQRSPVAKLGSSPINTSHVTGKSRIWKVSATPPQPPTIKIPLDGDANQIIVGEINQAKQQQLVAASETMVNKRTGNGILRLNGNTKSTTTITKQPQLKPVKFDDPIFERRRKSIQDGDVFIYPTLYKDLNECHKCSRDNKICSCNNITSDTTTRRGDKSRAGGCESRTTTTTTTTTTTQATTATKRAKKAASGQVSAAPTCDRRDVGGDSRGKTGTSKPNGVDWSNGVEMKSQVAAEGKGKSPTKEEKTSTETSEATADTFKAVYKISISTASIDQKSNQLKLSTPKVMINSGVGGGVGEGLGKEFPLNSAPRISAANHELNISAESRQNKSSEGSDGLSLGVQWAEEEEVKVNRMKLAATSSADKDDVRADGRLPTPAGGAIVSEKKQQTTNCAEQVDSMENLGEKTPGNGDLSPRPASATRIGPDSPKRGANKMVDMNNNCKESCDKNVTISTNSALMSQLLERERDGEEQLTCNLSVGDSIKIISTSIRVGGNKLMHSNDGQQVANNLVSNATENSHTSIVPIVQSGSSSSSCSSNLTSRRRNMASKLSRQAICEDTVDALDDNKSLNESEENLSGEGSPETPRESSDALEYSPILTSVRDYIKNVNTELQVQGPDVLGVEECCDYTLARQQKAEDMGQVGPMLSEGGGSTTTTLHLINGAPGAILTMAGSGIVAPATVISSATNQTLATLNTGAAGGVVGSAGPSSGFTTAGPLLIHSSQAAGEHLGGESPKKSIFEGASKDEILEYLEDARERVPEILMAADDVMVINENELIVVNQLEPGSPATPISIVEAIEVLGDDPASLVDHSGSQLIAATSTATDDCTLSNATDHLVSQSISMEDEAQQQQHSPDQLRHRLQQLYQAGSQLTGNSQFSSGNNTMDDDTGISSGDQFAGSGFNSKIDSSRNSMDTPVTPIEFSQPAFGCGGGEMERGRSDLKGFPSITGTTTPEGLEDQVGTINIDAIYTSVINTQDVKVNELSTSCLEGAPEVNATTTTADSINNVPAIDNQSALATLSARQGLGHGPLLAVRRRNSISSDGGGSPGTGSTGGDTGPVNGASVGSATCAIQMLRLQQRYSNRESLSSPSSTPPSSTSPSSSSTSGGGGGGRDQTSGNCSTASTFYASSSISCSSPLLDLAADNTTGVAFRGTHLIGNAQQAAGALDTYDAAGIHQSLDPYGLVSSRGSVMSPDTCSSDLTQVERDDSGLGGDFLVDRSKACATAAGALTFYSHLEPLTPEPTLASGQARILYPQSESNNHPLKQSQALTASLSLGDKHLPELEVSPSALEAMKTDHLLGGSQVLIPVTSDALAPSGNELLPCLPAQQQTKSTSSSMVRFNSTANIAAATISSSPTFSSSANLMSRSVHGHYATMNRLNNYFMNRHPVSENSDSTIEFQCLDCDQFIDVDHAKMLHKSNELRLLRESDREEAKLLSNGGGDKEKLMTTDQLDRAYIAAMNGLPLCSSCEKKRVERKEIISEFVETELKYGRDLKIIHDEFYRPMQIAGLLSKDQINGVFLNLEELIVAHCKFAIRLEAALRDAHAMGDTDFNTINIGRLFVESAEMLHTFESYCIRQGSAACLLARLAKEKELLRIFLRVSQMENTLLRRMNLAAFLMVPVQRVTKYPLLLNRLYKVTAYHHKDREVLRDAQLKVELHLEHINQQTKGVGATNKIWRRISNLSAPISNRRGLINAEDIGYIKLRKTAMDMLKWDRDETQFIHSGRLNFAPLNEFLIKQKMKPMRYMAAHALLIVLGKPNWKYRPDLVKSNLDNKLMTPTPGGIGVKEAALLLFREKGGRFIPCREPLFLSNCVLSIDCSQYNSECPIITANHHNQKIGSTSSTPAQANSSQTGSTCSNNSGDNNGNNNNNNNRVRLMSSNDCERRDSRDQSAGTEPQTSSASDVLKVHKGRPEMSDLRANSSHSDTLSMASVKSLPENNAGSILPPSHTSRSYSLASALPRTPSSGSGLTKSSSITSSNLTIINQLMTKVNSYGHKQQSSTTNGSCKVAETTKSQPMATITTPLERTFGGSTIIQQQPPPLTMDPLSTTSAHITSTMSNNNNNNSNRPTINQSSCPSKINSNINTNSSNANNTNNNNNAQNEMIHPQHYNHLFFNSHHHHHQPYGDYEESFEIHERLTKESMLLRADTPLKTRYWLQMLRYHAKDLGQWRVKRNGLANIMMMRQE